VELAEARPASARDIRARRAPGRPFHVGVLADNVPEFSFLLGGCAFAGAVLVALNPVRPRVGPGVRPVTPDVAAAEVRAPASVVHACPLW